MVTLAALGLPEMISIFILGVCLGCKINISMFKHQILFLHRLLIVFAYVDTESVNFGRHKLKQ